MFFLDELALIGIGWAIHAFPVTRKMGESAGRWVKGTATSLYNNVTRRNPR